MTSTNGVTLISLMTGRRRRRLPPRAEPVLRVPAAIAESPQPRSSICRDRMAVNSSAKPSKPLRLPVHLGGELIIENRRRDGGNEADCGREQQLGDAGGDHRQRGVLRLRDRLEACHNARHRAEQPDKRPRRTHRRQDQEAPLHILDFAGDGDIHDLFDAHLQSGKGAGVTLEAALPFAHGRDEQHPGGMSRLRGQRFIQLLERLARPEGFLEAGRRRGEAARITGFCRWRWPRPRPSTPIGRRSPTPTIQWACQNR